MDNFSTLKVATTGASWPRLGLGTWKCSDPKVTPEVVYQAIKTGWRHFDCACDYGNEKEVGLGIKKAIDEGIVKREQLWVTSKLWCSFHKKEHVEPAIRKTLSDLGLTYLDLYLIHFPISSEFVPIEERYPPGLDSVVEPEPAFKWIRVPLYETWRAMEALVDKKLAVHIGVSNFDLQLLQDLLSYCKTRPIVNQVELHPSLQQQNLVRFCASEKIAVTAYSPFGSKSYVPLDMASKDEPLIFDNPVLQRIAKAHKKTVAQVIIRWVLQTNPWLTVIPKTATVGRLQENFNVFDFQLTEQEMKEIEGLNQNRRYNDTTIYTQRKKSYLPIFSN